MAAFFGDVEVGSRVPSGCCTRLTTDIPLLQYFIQHFSPAIFLSCNILNYISHLQYSSPAIFHTTFPPATFLLCYILYYISSAIFFSCNNLHHIPPAIFLPCSILYHISSYNILYYIYLSNIILGNVFPCNILYYISSYNIVC